MISLGLHETEEEKLLQILRVNKETFGWNDHDIKSLDPIICTHRINTEEGFPPNQVDNCGKEMESLCEAFDEDYTPHYIAINEKLNALISQEESYPKYRVFFWLKDEDNNSFFFFHFFAIACKWMNSIVSLTHNYSSEAIDDVSLCDVARVYFNNLHGASNDDYDPVINQILTYLSPDDNISLLTPFNNNENKDALFSVDSNKSLGLNGLNFFLQMLLEPVWF